MDTVVETRRGILKSPTAAVSIVAANTSYTLHTLSTNRTGILRKVWIANRTGANAQVRIGETVAAVFTQRLPQIDCPNGSLVALTEEEIPDFEFTSNLVVQATQGAAAPTDIQVMPTVEELPGAD